MARHRCTRCKRDVGSYGRRHKYYSGVFCEECINWIRGGMIGGFGQRVRRRSLFGRIWDFFKDLVLSTRLSR